MSIQSTDTSPANYGVPFDDADADIILRSADQVDFRVYKNILAKASPIFADMFALPRETEKDTNSEIPVVPVTEDSNTVASLLTICYPFRVPSLETLEEIFMLLSAAEKYDIDRVRQVARNILYSSSQFTAHPIKAFRLACSHRLESETREAAKECLKGPVSLDSIGEEMRYMEGETVYQLYRYHTLCKDAMKQLRPCNRFPGEIPWLTSEKFNQCFTKEDRCQDCCTLVYTLSADERAYRPAWILGYMKAAESALKSHFTPASVVSNEVIARSFGTAAMACKARDDDEKSRCLNASMNTLLAFSQLVAEEVDRIVSSVSPLKSSTRDCRSTIVYRLR